MNGEQVIALLVGLFGVVVAVLSGVIRHRGAQVQKERVAVREAEAEADKLRAERDAGRMNDAELAKKLDEVLRRRAGGAAPGNGKRG